MRRKRRGQGRRGPAAATAPFGGAPGCLRQDSERVPWVLPWWVDAGRFLATVVLVGVFLALLIHGYRERTGWRCPSHGECPPVWPGSWYGCDNPMSPYMDPTPEMRAAELAREQVPWLRRWQFYAWANDNLTAEGEKGLTPWFYRYGIEGASMDPRPRRSGPVSPDLGTPQVDFATGKERSGIYGGGQ